MSAEEALHDNKRYAVVWEVLQALRAHDERFDAMVNRIDLTKQAATTRSTSSASAAATTRARASSGAEARSTWPSQRPRRAGATPSTPRSSTRSAPAATGDWAKSRRRHRRPPDHPHQRAARRPRHRTSREEFDAFLDGLRGNLNDGITQADAIDMLAQHLITRPVFDALFEGYEFLEHNPVAQTMERMLAALDEHNLDDENRTLEKFYDSVRMRVEGID